MLHTLNDIYQRLDSKLVTALLTIDLSNAFDCLDHEILLLKLEKLQFSEKFHHLLKSYLTNRFQFVKIDGIISEKKQIYCGAPQGGVLSGLFFIIYVNQIFSLSLKNKIRLFCDDMSLIACGSTKDELKLSIQHDLSLILNWLDMHQLKANLSKTSYVLFSGRKKFEPFTERSLNIKIGDTEIERVECVKIIGLIIDEQLNFSNHIQQIKSRIIPFTAKLLRIRRFLTDETALKLYYAHIYSHLIFMNTIWSVAPKYLIESLAVIQRRALRIVLRKDRLCHNTELFTGKIFPLAAILSLHENIMLFKMKHEMTKNNVTLRTVQMMHNHNTRNRFDLVGINTSSAIGQNNFYYRAIRSFNSLPDDIKKFNSIGLFKNRLKEHLAKSITIEEA